MNLTDKEINWFMLPEELKFFEEQCKKENERIEWLLRNSVVPPIKGKITASKVKWRGLALAYQNKGLESTRLLLQRGKEVWVISQITCKIDLK